jgi:uncharacterized protein
MSAEDFIEETRHWVERAVIGLNLCPFARAVQAKGQVRYVVSDATTPEALLEDLKRELRLLEDVPAEQTDTTLLIHPHVLGDFLDYNDFLGVAEETLADMGLEGVLQVASFHPDYQFEGTQKDDIANYTNRSPWPTLHILREASVDKAVAAYPDPEEIYRKNIDTLRSLGAEGWERLGLRSGRRKGNGETN